MVRSVGLFRFGVDSRRMQPAPLYTTQYPTDESRPLGVTALLRQVGVGLHERPKTRTGKRRVVCCAVFFFFFFFLIWAKLASFSACSPRPRWPSHFEYSEDSPAYNGHINLVP